MVTGVSGDSNHPLQIATRRHPLALACYFLVLSFGVLFVSGGVRSQAVRQTISPLFVLTWEWSMVLGGAAALAGSLWRGIDRGLSTEAFGALSCTFGLLTYTGSVMYVVGGSSPGWVLTGCLALGCAARSLQAYLDLQKVERAASHPPESFVLRGEHGSPA